MSIPVDVPQIEGERLPVAWIQSYLVRAFGERLDIDGRWGAKTAAAMARRLPPVDAVSPPWVYPLFPVASRSGIDAHFFRVKDALAAEGLGTRDGLLVALATIRAETEGFRPICERISRWNTERAPFDRYDFREDLGNTEPGDGMRYRGRGFVQLTGRFNYADLGEALGLPLVEHPEVANTPRAAPLILAAFLRREWTRIERALARRDLAAARRAVNGGSHGLDRFRGAYTLGEALWPRWSA